MRVLLKMTLDCDADAAWDAIRSPRVLGDVSSPLLRFDSLEPGGFPERWGEGEHPVRVLAAGIVPMGVQVIGISYPERIGSVAANGPGTPLRAMRDTGRGLSGPLAVITRWQHTLTVAPLPDGRTLYRDRLVFEAGPLTLVLWPLYWAFWQWRGAGMRRLARGWRRGGASS
jgi:hypothetical protein